MRFPLSHTPPLLPSSPGFCFKHSFACSPVAVLASNPGEKKEELNKTLSFSCHTHTATQPHHVQRNQTHLKSVHKRRGENKHSAFVTKIKRSSLYIQHAALTLQMHLHQHPAACDGAAVCRISAGDWPHSSHYLSAYHSS